MSDTPATREKGDVIFEVPIVGSTSLNRVIVDAGEDFFVGTVDRNAARHAAVMAPEVRFNLQEIDLCAMLAMQGDGDNLTKCFGKNAGKMLAAGWIAMREKLLKSGGDQ